MKLDLTPAQTESLDGFLRRLAAAEFWPDVSDFLAGVGHRYGRHLVEQTEQLAELLELPGNVLREITPSANPRHPRMNWRFERHHSAPVCPACIAEGRPHHQAWRHVFVTSCAEHGLRLIDDCPMCGETFRPGCGGYDSCHCGCPLDRLARVDADQSEVAVAALISGAMQPARSLLPPSLAFQEPADIGDFIYFLATGGAKTETGKEGKTPLPRTVQEARALVEPALNMLCDWPRCFQEKISERLQNADGSSAPMRLGRWYQRLMQFDGVAYADFHRVLQDVVTREFDGAYVGGTCSDSAQRDWMSASEAARVLGIRAERLVEAVYEGVIEGRQYSSGFGHRHTVLHRSTVHQINLDRACYIDRSAAREFLGISRKQYDLVLASGLLASSLSPELPPLCQGPHDLAELKRIVVEIADHACDQDGESVAFKDLNLRFTTDLAGLSEVMRKIADLTIRPLGQSVQGKLADFHFLRREVDAVLADIRRGPGLTVQQVAMLTGWKDQCVAQWCRQGLIEHETFAHAGKTGRVIRSDALSRFQECYVPVSSLARQLQTSPRHLMARLSASGVKTVGSFQEGNAWRGHLVPMKDLISSRIQSHGVEVTRNSDVKDTL